TRARIDAFQAKKIIVDGAFVRRVLVLADVDAEHAGEARAFGIADKRIDAFVVESEPVDDGSMFRQSPHARLWIAGLRTRRRRADFNEAETERGECIDVCAVLVEAGGESNRIGKLDTEGTCWQ